MFIDIETERLSLKCIAHSDRDFIFEEFQDDFINRFLYDQEPMTDIHEADDLIDFYTMNEPRNQNRWVMIDKNSNNKIGTCGFHVWNRDRQEVEIGFELLETYNGKGFMSEAVEAIIEFAKLQMRVSTIKAIVSIGNNKCKKLVENFGFKATGKEEDCVFRGNLYKHCIYEKKLYWGL